MSLTSSRFLRTRIARRLLLLFVLCSAGPLLVIGWLSQRQVIEVVRAQKEEELHRAVKDVGLDIFTRLQDIAGELRSVSTVVASLPPEALDLGRTISESPYSTTFRSLTVTRPGGLLTLAGEPPPLPELSPSATNHLSAGRPLIRTACRNEESCLLLAVAIEPANFERGVLWGELDPAELYLADFAHYLLPTDGKLCVFDHSGWSLTCSAGESGATGESDGGAETFTSDGIMEAVRTGTRELGWREGDTEYFGTSWQLFLAHELGAPSWRIVAGVPSDSVRQALGMPQVAFTIALALAVALMFLLGNILIRRSLQPIEALTDATERLAGRDFSVRVDVDSDDEFKDLAVAFNDMGGQLERQFALLDAIATIDRSVLAALGTDAVGEVLLSETSRALAADLVNVVRMDANGVGEFRALVRRAAGSEEISRGDVELSPAEVSQLRELDGYLYLGAEPEDFDELPGYLERMDCEPSNWGGAILFPLHWEGELTGVLLVGWLEPPVNRASEAARARQLVDQVGLALGNARMVERLDAMSWGSIRALANTVDAKSAWTHGHSTRVTELSVALGREMGLSVHELERLKRGGLVHDIGKVGIKASVLDKPGQLTDEEFREIQRHPEIGATILEPIEAFSEIIPIVLSHHERLDGSGYPHGLIGEQIPLLVRIVAVADVWDAATRTRPYQRGKTAREVLEEMIQGSGTLYDPAVVSALESLMEGAELDAPATDGFGWDPPAADAEEATRAGRMALQPAAAK